MGFGGGGEEVGGEEVEGWGLGLEGLKGWGVGGFRKEEVGLGGGELLQD